MHSLHTATTPIAGSRSCRCLICQLLVWLAFFILALAMPVNGSESRSAATTRTLDSLKRINGITDQDIRKYTPQITALSYTAARGVRALCRLPDISPKHIPQILALPGLATIRYSAVPLLEYYVTLPGATLSGSSELINQLRDIPFVTEQALADLPRMHADKAGDCLTIVRQLGQLDEAGLWAASSLFTVKGITTDAFLSGIAQLARIGMAQKRAAEKALETDLLQPAAVPELLSRLSGVDDNQALNLSGLLTKKKMTARELHHWLDIYFSLATKERQTAYLALTPHDKTLLLAGFSAAAGMLAEKINNLHDVTDGYGMEIGHYRLSKMSASELRNLFSQLDTTVRGRFEASLQQSIARHDTQRTINILRQATVSARRQAAHSLGSENIYALLANGSELFDSSFRDILVPILVTRMKEQYTGDLLSFLLATDPESILVSDFLTHLAWKGKLTTFFPTDSRLQQKILELLAQSALRNEQSLIFFSATFTSLLEALHPTARSTLLDVLLKSAEAGNAVFSKQVRVILQDYLEHHPQLLSRDDKVRISVMLNRLGRIDLTPYTSTPFTQWLGDGRLTSLSVFQNDDDGRQSYIANCSYLLQQGYLPTLSKEYSLEPVTDAVTSQIDHVIRTLSDRQGQSLNLLFQLAGRYPLVIDWQKRLNTVEIIHSVYVYHGKTAQQQLLKIYLTKDHELFAQRGHSYWRNEQLLRPLEQLVQTHEILPEVLTAKQRFISIGSCGGIRAYAELNRRFANKVDILATVGTGKSMINTPYNTRLFEIIASNYHNQRTLTWQDIATGADRIFSADAGREYIQPGSLPAILHKMMTQ